MPETARKHEISPIRDAPPAELIRRWPRSTPLVCWIPADQTHSHESPRPALIAEPGTPSSDRTFDTLAAPSTCGTIAALPYEIARDLEPAVRTRVHPWRAADPLAFPIQSGLTRASNTEPWCAIGTPPQFTEPAEHPPRVETHLRSNWGKGKFIDAAARCVELIRRGDAFQINLAHHLTAECRAEPRELFAAIVESLRPRYACLIDTHPDNPKVPAYLCASPELFLAYNPDTRELLTRPMKGTRPASEDTREFQSAEKDTAELAMITDLMRNDLGRSAALASVKVTTPRTIERHAGPAGVLQATSEVRATLHTDRTPVDALREAFPPGSITGAPKVRAMQIIETLEPEPRGLYCGAIAWARPDGSLESTVAIRTITIWNGILSLPVGAGIVADSDPEAEWRETLTKAAPFTAVGLHLAENP